MDKFIQRLDPDIITGYNIFGFDFALLCEVEKFYNCSTKQSNIIENKYGKSRHDDYCETNKFAQLSRDLDHILFLKKKLWHPLV